MDQKKTVAKKECPTTPEKTPEKVETVEEKVEEVVLKVSDTEDESFLEAEEEDFEKKQMLMEISDLKERLRKAIDILTGAQPWHPQLGELKEGLF